MESGRGFVLHSSDYVQDATMVIDKAIAMTATTDILRDIAEGEGPRSERALAVTGHQAVRHLEQEAAAVVGDGEGELAVVGHQGVVGVLAAHGEAGAGVGLSVLVAPAEERLEAELLGAGGVRLVGAGVDEVAGSGVGGVVDRGKGEESRGW